MTDSETLKNISKQITTNEKTKGVTWNYDN